MKDLELKLISELMKNGRRSDRELAKAIGSSQPTITRNRIRLEREGYIKAYSMIPDFAKLGFEIMALTFTRFKRQLTDAELKKLREAAREIEKGFPHPAIMVMTGIGLGYDRVVLTLHENYKSYVEFMRITKQLPFLDLMQIDSFLMTLAGENNYMPLNLSNLANYMLSPINQKKGLNKIRE